MPVRYNTYFGKLPKLNYDIKNSIIDKQYEKVTDIFFRVGYIKEVLNNLSSYYTVEIEDGDTPEILAEKVYEDAGAGWMILMANQIIDPQYEWPLDYDSFNKYIADKYDSVENAKITYHHYEMVIIKELQPDNIITESRYIVNKEKLTVNNLDFPYNYYEVYGTDPGSLAFTQSVNIFNIEGKTVTETKKGEAITNYDYELALNDSRRFIKIIKKEYYDQIIKEFDNLTSFNPPYIRRVR
jgi:hypothetical protein